jgi:hypothetical protein
VHCTAANANATATPTLYPCVARKDRIAAQGRAVAATGGGKRHRGRGRAQGRVQARLGLGVWLGLRLRE